MRYGFNIDNELHAKMRYIAYKKGIPIQKYIIELIERDIKSQEYLLIDYCKDEEWRLIPSLNNKYEVTKDGKVRNAGNKKILKPQTNKLGYKTLTVRPNKNEIKNVRIHKLVAEVYLGECPEGYVVNHKDGNKINNNIDNLEYITPSGNNLHALQIGLRKPANMKQFASKGENHYKTSITEDDVIAILKYHYITGYGYRRCAKYFGVSRGITSGIISGKTWRHLDREQIKKSIIKENNGYE